MPQMFASLFAKSKGVFRKPFRRAAAIGAAVVALSVSAVITAVQGPDLSILLYPLPTSNVEQSLRITGLTEPGQTLRLQVDDKTVAITRANASGDFAAKLVLPVGAHTVQVVGDNGRFSSSLSSPYRVRQLDIPRAPPRAANPASALAAKRASTLPSAEFSIQSASAPTITVPPSTSTSNPITLSGSAQASSTVSLYVNGRFTRSVVATAGGTYSTWIPLEDGLNSIYATANDGTGESPASNTVEVTYTNTIPRTYAATTISQNTVWTAGSAPTYTLTGVLTIAPGATLWIQPGVTLSFSSYYWIDSQGAFIVRGTSASRAVLRPSTTACTASSQARSDWSSVWVRLSGTADIDYADFHCAASAVIFENTIGSVRHSRFFGNATGISTSGGAASPLIAGQNEIRNSTNGIKIGANSQAIVSGENLITANTTGILVDPNFGATALPIVNGNSIFGNSQYNYMATGFNNANQTVLNARGNWWGTADPYAIAQTIWDLSDSSSGWSPVVDFGGFLSSAGGPPAPSAPTLLGPVTQDTTLAAGEYLQLSDVTVNAGVTWTLLPGTTIRALPGVRVRVNGMLQAVGNSTERVHFGSAATYPKKGDWDGIEVAGAGSAVNLDRVRIEHATNGVYFNGGQGSIARSLIRFNEYGVYVGRKSNPIIGSENQISHNDYGIYVYGNNNGPAADNAQPIVNGNSLFANAFYNYYSTAFSTPLPTLDATGNWWGTATSTGVAATIYTAGSTSAPVNYSGFLVAEPIPQAMYVSGFAMSEQQVKPLISTLTAAGAFTINRSGTVTYRIVRDSDGAIVRQWTQVYATPGSYAFAWDGLNDQGAVAAGGLYRIVLIASDGLDPFVHDLAPPTATDTVSPGYVTPTYNPYLNEFFKATGTYAQAAVVSLRVTPQNGTPFYVWRDVYYPAGSHWFYWDGRGSDGHLLTTPSSVLATDRQMRASGIYVVTPAVTIAGTGAAPNIEIKSDPNLITHSYDQSSQIVYRIDVDAVVRVTLLPFGVVDPNHPSAIVLVDNVAQSAKDVGGNPIDHVAEWRGYSDTDLNNVLLSTDGAYTFAIEATLPSTGQKTLYRGILNVWQ
jgi:hypothetical protein